MSLRKGQKRMLYEEGFLAHEISAFENARGGDTRTQHRVKMDFNFNSRPFRAMRRARRKYIADLRNAGWDNLEIKKKINEYYHLKTGRSPFDFLKLSYAPTRKITDFQDAIKRRIRSRVSRTLGKLYNRNLHAASKARSIPKRAVYPSRPKLVRRVRRTR